MYINVHTYMDVRMYLLYFIVSGYVCLMFCVHTGDTVSCLREIPLQAGRNDDRFGVQPNQCRCNSRDYSESLL